MSLLDKRDGKSSSSIDKFTSIIRLSAWSGICTVISPMTLLFSPIHLNHLLDAFINGKRHPNSFSYPKYCDLLIADLRSAAVSKLTTSNVQEKARRDWLFMDTRAEFISDSYDNHAGNLCSMVCVRGHLHHQSSSESCLHRLMIHQTFTIVRHLLLLGVRPHCLWISSLPRLPGPLWLAKPGHFSLLT